MSEAQPKSVSRKRATVILVLGGYVNTGIQVVQGLLLIPLYLHFVGAQLYGLWMASGGTLGILGLLNFGIGNMLVQRVANAHGKQDLPKAGAYFINGMVVYLAIVAIFISTGLLISFWLPEWLKTPYDNAALLRGCFQFAVLASASSILNECLRGFAQALLRPGYSVVAIPLSRIAGIVVTAVLLYKNAGLWAIPLGMLTSEILILITMLVQAQSLFRELNAKFKLDISIVKEYFKVGTTTILAKIGSALSTESDALLITLIMRPELTTVYMITRRAADIVFQMLAVIYGSSHSAFSHLVGIGDQNKISEVSTKLLTMVVALGLIGFATYVAMNHSFIALWVGNDFSLDQSMILVLGVAFLISSVRNMTWQLLNGFGEYRYSSKVIFLESVGKIILAVIFLKTFGISGMPLALAISSLVSLIVLMAKLLSHVKLTIGRQYLINILTIIPVAFGICEYLARAFQTTSWLTFALMSGVTVLATSILCAMANWPMFKVVIRNYRL